MKPLPNSEEARRRRVRPLRPADTMTNGKCRVASPRTLKPNDQNPFDRPMAVSRAFFGNKRGNMVGVDTRRQRFSERWISLSMDEPRQVRLVRVRTMGRSSLRLTFAPSDYV